MPAYSDVNVWVWPLDLDAAYRAPCALSDTFAGLLLPDAGESTRDDNSDANGFEAIQWHGQTLLKEPKGPLEWVTLNQKTGILYRGVRSVKQSKPKDEICGWTTRPTFRRLQSTIADPAPVPGSPDYDLRPRLPQGEPTREWIAQQGENWERVAPNVTPLWTGLRHKAAPANRAVKVRTKSNWLANAGALIELDGNGVAFGHDGVPGLRIEWGNSWSLVFRGLGKDARPRLERKGSDKNGNLVWRAVRTLDEAAPLDEKWWSGKHTVSFYRMAQVLIVEIDGFIWWVADIQRAKIVPVAWKASPLRVSLEGADVLFRVASLSFDREAGFKREVPVAAPPSQEVSWTCKGTKMERIAVPGLDTIIETGVPFFDAIIKALTATGKALIRGFDLSESSIDARWFEADEGIGRIDYEVKLKGTQSTAPFLCAFAAQFPPTAQSELAAPVNLRPALNSVEIETGEPERMPTGNAKFSLSVPLAELVIERWDEVKDVLPFRRVFIETNEAGDGVFKSVFNGRLFPEGVSSDGWNGGTINATCYDLTALLKSPAALVNGRFGPLDLDASYLENAAALYGGQCVQKLLGYEIGPDIAGALNGDGNWRRYLPKSHYPLLEKSGNDFFNSGAVESSAQFHLVPPYGDDVLKWIDTIRGFDHAVFFFDSMLGDKGAFVYGHIDKIYKERGLTVHDLHENADGISLETNTSLAAWPLLSSYQSQGLLERAFTRVEVWGAGTGTGDLAPSLFVGSATTPLPATDPLSEIQSWPRWFLSRQDFIGTRTTPEFADALAQTIWREFDGREPERADFTLNDQIRVVRWGELVTWQGTQRRVLSSKLSWRFDGDKTTRQTTITARSLSATGL